MLRRHLFPALLPILLFTLLAADAPPASLPATQAATQPARDSFPTYGLSFTPPANWTPDPRPDSTCIARYFHRDPATHELLADISLTVDRNSVNAHELAARIALSDPSAAALTQSFEVDHLPTLALRKDRPDRISRPYLMLITQRNPHELIIFHARGLVGDSPNQELVTLCKSLHWSPCESPINHLDLAPDTVSLFGDHGPTLRLPAIFRRDVEKSDSQKAVFLAVDGDTGQPAIALIFGQSPFPFKNIRETNPAVLVRESARTAAGARGRPDEIPPDVEKLPAPQNGAYSSVFVNALEHPPENQPPTHIRVGLIVTDTSALTVLMSMYRLDDHAVEIAAPLLPQILKTIHLPAAPPATTSQPAKPNP